MDEPQFADGRCTLCRRKVDVGWDHWCTGMPAAVTVPESARPAPPQPYPALEADVLAVARACRLLLLALPPDRRGDAVAGIEVCPDCGRDEAGRLPCMCECDE